MSETATRSACSEQATEGELLARLDEVLEEYKNKAGNLIPVLQIAQGIFGYLPEVALKRIALALGKSYSEVAGVVGFYSFFSTVPRGKHLVRVCLGTACYVRGGKLVLDALKQELGIDVGGTTEDRLFSLDVGRCFGACGLAPTIMIGDEVRQRVKPARIRAILEEYRNGGGRKPEAKAAAPKAPASKPASKSAASKAKAEKAGSRAGGTKGKAPARRSAAAGRGSAGAKGAKR
jgi:NADH:ubiquinone oxidoreductase subunit E